MREELYYIQDTRNYVGNCVLWWCSNGDGYTTNIDEAGLFTVDQIDKRPTDKAWPRKYIISKAYRVIDMQYLNKKESR